MMIFGKRIPRRIFWSAAALVAVAGAAITVAVVVSGGEDNWGHWDDCPERVVLPGGRMETGEQAVAAEQAGACFSVRCHDVEIYDAQLAAVSLQGSNAGFKGSGYGCVPVCVWHNDGDLAVELDEVKFYLRIPDSIEIDHSGVIAPHRNYLFQNSKEVFGPDIGIHGTEVAFAHESLIEVRLSPNQRSCHILDISGKIAASQPASTEP